MLKDELEARLRHRTLRRTSFGVGQQPRADPLVLRPGVGVLLEVDQEYRSRSDEGALKRIAPRRFNPSGDAWLPILHTERDGWAFTARAARREACGPRDGGRVQGVLRRARARVTFEHE